MPKPETVIPLSAVPPRATQELEVDGKRILLRNEIMYTSYQHSCGEHSPFMFALRDEKKILGHQCPECGQIICPPFMQRCTACNFAQMTTVEMPDRGVMVASPTITFFGNARFKTRVPFALGYVYLGESQTGLLTLCYTTKGLLRAGVFVKGTPVKVVFADARTGAMSDVFVVPEAELSEKQLTRPGLLESELRFVAADKPAIQTSPQYERAHAQVLDALRQMIEQLPRSPRAVAALADWTLSLSVETGGGRFGLAIGGGTLRVTEVSANADLQMVSQDPQHLLDWVQGQSLTNLVADGEVWIDKSEGLNTVFVLDRLPRALRRDLGD